MKVPESGVVFTVILVNKYPFNCHFVVMEVISWSLEGPPMDKCMFIMSMF